MHMQRRAQAWISRALFALWLLPFAAPAQQAASGGAAPQAVVRNEAGKITLVAGAVNVTGLDKTRRVPKQGEMLYEGDTIATGGDGELQAELLDSGVIAVRASTQMSITKYQAQGDANDTSVFNLLKGSFRSITGWIGKNNPTKYQINTPTATIGVRGTDHEPLVIPEGSSSGEPGTYDKVSAGGSFIQGKTGRVDVTPGKSGFFSFRGNERPRLLDRVPAFYRPSRNEARLEGLHDRLRPQLEARRTERAQFVRTQRAQGIGPGARPGAQNNNRGAQQFGPRGQPLGNGAQNLREQRQARVQELQKQRQEQIQQRQQNRPQGAAGQQQGRALENRAQENRQQLLQNRQQQAGQQQGQQQARQQALQARQQQMQQNRQQAQQQRQQVQQQRQQAQQHPNAPREREEQKKHHN